MGCVTSREAQLELRQSKQKKKQQQQQQQPPLFRSRSLPDSLKRRVPTERILESPCDGDHQIVHARTASEAAQELIEILEDPEAAKRFDLSLLLADFDPVVVANFRRAMSEISPKSRSRLAHTPEPNTPRLIRHGTLSKAKAAAAAAVEQKARSPKLRGLVKARISAFEQKLEEKLRKRAPPGGERKVVMYTTSIGAVRKSYDDCRAMRVLLQEGYGVRVDERDVSIHGEYKEEVRELLGKVMKEGRPLPRVFANGKYLGGAEEVRRLHDCGALRRLLTRCDRDQQNKSCCEVCGDVRFVVCGSCNGSCKVYVEDAEDGEGGGFWRCKLCNDNGLVRCNACHHP